MNRSIRSTFIRYWPSPHLAHARAERRTNHLSRRMRLSRSRETVTFRFETADPVRRVCSTPGTADHMQCFAMVRTDISSTPR